MSRTNRRRPSDHPDHQPDPVEAYLTAYVDAVEQGEEPPPLDDLDEATRAEATQLLGLLAASDRDRDSEAERVVAGETADTPTAAGGGDSGVALRPRAESGFALAHQFVRPAPDVVVVGETVRQVRTAAGVTTADVAAEMTRRGASVDAAALDALEGSSASRLPPREARLLAAVLDQPLAAIEAAAEPWPSAAAGLEALRQAGADAVVLGQDVVIRTTRGDHLGVLRCRGDATLLDSRTYRQAAAALLTGPWSYLAGALLVTEQPPYLALAVDALDCVTRWHAPSGLSGFSRLAEPEPIAEAVASYDRTYTVRWTDPEPLREDADDLTEGTGDAGLASRVAGIVERLGKEGRRARQPGKGPGYEAASRWLGAMPAHDVAGLLDDLATMPAETARARLAGELGGEVIAR